MLVRLIQIEREMRGGISRLIEVYINPRHIISIADDYQMNEVLVSESIRLGLEDGAKFSKVVVQEGSNPKTITIVGTPAEIHSKIKKRQILRG